MSVPPSELEWLGFEMALRRYFVGHTAQAPILTQLVRHAGITQRSETLALVANVAEESVPVYISWLREAMRDLGFRTQIETVKGAGYRLSESGAAEVWSRVMTVVERIREAA